MVSQDKQISKDFFLRRFSEGDHQRPYLYCMTPHTVSHVSPDNHTPKSSEHEEKGGLGQLPPFTVPFWWLLLLPVALGIWESSRELCGGLSPSETFFQTEASGVVLAHSAISCPRQHMTYTVYLH